jgi:hypothetical protein
LRTIPDTVAGYRHAARESSRARTTTTDRMANEAPHTTTPALELLRRIAASGGDGMSHGAVFDNGLPGHAASKLVEALRSRGYVRFDRTTGHWVATLSGLRRADAVDVPAPPSLHER